MFVQVEKGMVHADGAEVSHSYINFTFSSTYLLQ